MMSDQLAPPEQPRFWSASAVGSGELTWNVQPGQWTLVVLNTDTSAGVSADLTIGATVPGLRPVAIGLLCGGVVAIAGGVLLQYAGLRRRGERPGPKGQ